MSFLDDWENDMRQVMPLWVAWLICLVLVAGLLLVLVKVVS